MAFGIKRISIFTVTFSSVVLYIGFYAWRIMFNNFAVEIFDASPTDVGLIQSAREIPGLLAFGVAALALYLNESKIAGLSIIAVGLGLVACGMATSILWLGMATVLMSFGFHYFEPTNSAQLLMLADSNEFGRAQGKLRSWESAAGLAGAGIILGATAYFDYRWTFFIIGGAVTVIGIYLTLALPPNRMHAEKRKVQLKKKYALYYTLSFLRGCRRHVFTTFAIFLLVKNHELDITVISTIMLANSAITIFTNRYLGHLSDKLGEKTILVTSSLLLVGIFTGYAYITWLPALILFYLMDNILFGSSIALKSYVRKISTAEDLTSCLSFGMTSNHITAIIIPIAGGVMWTKFGYETTFLAGAGIVLIDALFALRLPGRKSLTETFIANNGSNQD